MSKLLYNLIRRLGPTHYVPRSESALRKMAKERYKDQPELIYDEQDPPCDPEKHEPILPK
jgi:hypothetical protein